MLYIVILVSPGPLLLDPAAADPGPVLDGGRPGHILPPGDRRQNSAPDSGGWNPLRGGPVKVGTHSTL